MLFFQTVHEGASVHVHREHDERHHDGVRHGVLLGHAARHHQPPRGEERRRPQDRKVGGGLN